MDLNVIEFNVADFANGEPNGLFGTKEKLKTTGSNLWQYMESYHTDTKRTQSTR